MRSERPSATPLDDVYAVNNAYSSLSVFQKSGALVQSYRVGQIPGSMTAVAMDGPNLMTSQSYSYSTANNAALLQSWDADSLVTGNIVMHQNDFVYQGAFVIGIAKDSAGTIWAADSTNRSIIRQVAITSSFQNFKVLNYTPPGIAVDSVRGLIYVSDLTNSSIHVYNGKAQLVALIR